MKVKSIFCIIILIINSSCFSQNNRIENKLMECYYQSFQDNGIEIKKLIHDYENLLINEGFLKDNSAKSYITFLQNFSNQNIYTPSKFFCVESQNIKKLNEVNYLECRKLVLEDFKHTNTSKLESIEKAVINNSNPQNVVKDMLKVLTKEDFEIEYYKRQAFLVFCLIDTEAGLKKRDD
nr:hypothetical protein [uncultured Lacinutrix sp.]